MHWREHRQRIIWIGSRNHCDETGIEIFWQDQWWRYVWTQHFSLHDDMWSFGTFILLKHGVSFVWMDEKKHLPKICTFLFPNPVIWQIISGMCPQLTITPFTTNRKWQTPIHSTSTRWINWKSSFPIKKEKTEPYEVIWWHIYLESASIANHGTSSIHRFLEQTHQSIRQLSTAGATTPEE